MLVTETKEIDGVNYLHNYSDAGMYIERDGIEYADAIDPLNSGRVYTETNHKIEEIVPDESDRQE